MRVPNDVDFGALVRHYRKMVGSLDPFSIIVRGLSMIDVALEWLIEAYSALPFKDFGRLGLHQKLNLACGLGAISLGERDSLLELNRLRNDAAHKMDFDITQADEQRLVDVFKSKVRVLSGLDYNPQRFPVGFAFVLLTMFQLFSVRRQRPNVKLSYVDDVTNTEAMMAIVTVRTIDEVRRRGIENDDAAVMEVVRKYSEEAKALKQPN